MRHFFIRCAALLGWPFAIVAQPAAEPCPFRNPQLTVEERLADLIGRMTVEEKIDLLSSYRNWYLHPCERLGVPAFQMADGPLGLASWGEFGRATAYPAALTVAASWDPELSGRLGAMYAREFRARGIHFLLAPGVNNYRASRGARNFEYMGEDPFLASRMVVPFIRGVQQGGVIATVKHFVGNDQEFDRYRVSTEVSERALREIYLPPFQAAVQEAGVKAVMTGYNLLNGVYMSEHPLLTELLRNEWGFKGIVMSDWSSVHSRRAILSDLDLEMGSNRWLIREKMLPMLRDGSLDTSTIDEKVRHIYTPCMEMGFFDRPQRDPSIPLFNPEANLLSYEAATQGIVLLRNESGLLPLDRTKIRRIAVIGPNACPAVVSDARYDVSAVTYGGGGSSRVHPWYVISPLEGIIEEFPEAEVLYAEGISNRFKTLCFGRSLFRTEDGRPGLSGRYFSDTGECLLERTDVKIDFEWDAAVGEKLPFGDDFRAEWSGCVVAEQTDTLVFFLDMQGCGRLWIDGRLVLDASASHSFYSGQVRIPVREAQRLDLRLEYANRKCVPAEIRLGYASWGDVDFSEALSAARGADAVVFCAGLDGSIEREGRDRPFALPFGQKELICRLAAVNPNLIVTVTAGGGVEMAPWIERSAALLYLGYPGQEGGRALAHILSGKVNPSGKLPFTWERRWEDSPAFGNYDETRDERKVCYREGVFTGYRGYDARGETPLFAFGFGLSYTDFSYAKPEVVSFDRKAMTATVACTVTNSGDRSGAEVVQLYIRDVDSSEPRPLKELKGFRKLRLEAGESARVCFDLDREDFSFFSEKQRRWIAESGDFEIWIGASSSDIRLRIPLKL